MEPKRSKFYRIFNLATGQYYHSAARNGYSGWNDDGELFPSKPSTSLMLAAVKSVSGDKYDYATRQNVSRKTPPIVLVETECFDKNQGLFTEYLTPKMASKWLGNMDPQDIVKWRLQNPLPIDESQVV